MIMVDKKNNRGGARAGSGRKKGNNVNLCVRMPKDTVEYIKRKSKEENVTLGTWIERRIIKQNKNGNTNHKENPLTP